MSALARLVFRDPGPRAPLVRVAPRPRRIVELEDEGSFALAIQQAEAIRRNAPGRGERRQGVEVVILVSQDKQEWHDVEVFWRGPWRPSCDGGIPLPTVAALTEVGQQAGARFVKSVIRSTI